MPVDGDPVFFTYSFQQVAGDPDLVAGFFGAFGEDLELPLAGGHFRVDPFYVEAGIQTGIEVFFHDGTAVGVTGADRTIIRTLRPRVAAFGKAEGFVCF